MFSFDSKVFSKPPFRLFQNFNLLFQLFYLLILKLITITLQSIDSF